MAIEIRPSGEPVAIAQAGLAIGQAEREKEERARAERAAEQASQDRARQMAMEWDAQKMLLNSQQDFAHEQRLHQTDLEAEARAKEWEVQKMVLRSQMDFQQEEQARQKEYDEFLTTEKYIRDKVTSGELPPEKAEDLYFMNAYQHSKLDKPEVVARLGGSTEYVQKIQGVGAEKGIFTPSNIQKGLGVIATGAPTSPMGIPLPTLSKREEYETFATQEWGPNWRVLVPEAEQAINQKFGVPVIKPGTRELDENSMAQFIIGAGGNIEQAKKLARQSGYKVD